MRSGVILLAVLLAAGVGHAADEGRVLRASAEQLAAQDRCEEALPRVARARELEPNDARAALVEGRCALRLNEYARAASALEAAQRLDPSIAGLHADLAIAYFHLDRRRDTARALDAAEQEDPSDARVALYRGLLLLADSENVPAAAEFERAAALDSELGPLANYYAGRAFQDEEDREKAQIALERVKAQAPGSTWAEQADLALARLDEPYLPHRWMRLQAGMDFDSNVVLRGENVDLPESISDEQDGRAHWSTDFGWEFFRDPKWSMGLMPAYSGNAHIDLTRYDLHFPNVSAWIDRQVDEVSFVRLRPHVGYAVLSGDPYVVTGGGELSYQRFFGEAGGIGRLFTEVTGNDYRYDANKTPVSRLIGDESCLPGGEIPGCDTDVIESLDATVRQMQDRDGVLATAGYEHRLHLGPDSPLDSYLRGGLSGGHYEAEGDEYDHDTVKVWLGARKELFANFTLDVLGSFAYEPYENRSSFQSLAQLVDCQNGPCALRTGGEREERIWNVRVLFERPFNDYMIGTVRWNYTDNDSNTESFDFKRHIVGGYITIYYGG